MTAECTSIAIYCREPSPTNIIPLVMSPRSPTSDIREADSSCRSCSIEVERTGHCCKSILYFHLVLLTPLYTDCLSVSMHVKQSSIMSPQNE
jgi:hypothetical protein